jgi:endonuclease III
MGENWRCGKRWPAVLGEVTDRLKREYGTPWLGNFVDPVKEIFFILLSARTSERLYVRAMDALISRYPTCREVADADVESVMACISVAGLGKKRSEQVIRIATRLIQDFGDHPEAELRSMSPPEVYEYLTSLPGVGPKSAFCVMMWSLNIDVLPVDVNVQRIAARLGVIPVGLKHYQAQQRFPRYVPFGRSRELHTVLMVHGRVVCTPRNPKCEECIVNDLCPTGQKSTAKRRNQ